MQELQTMMRFALITFMTVSASLSYADEAVHIRFRVGEMDFCVPQAAVAEMDIWWIPRELPDDGFVFQIEPDELPDLVPSVDSRGRKRALVGSITQGRTDQFNAGRSVLARRAAARSAIIERTPASDLVVVYESARRDHWTVWKLPIEFQANAEILERIGEPIATCSKPAGITSGRWKGSQSICRRHIDFEGLRLGYSMDAENLKNIFTIDEQLKRRVIGWRCGS